MKTLDRIACWLLGHDYAHGYAFDPESKAPLWWEHCAQCGKVKQ